MFFYHLCIFLSFCISTDVCSYTHLNTITLTSLLCSKNLSIYLMRAFMGQDPRFSSRFKLDATGNERNLVYLGANKLSYNAVPYKSILMFLFLFSCPNSKSSQILLLSKHLPPHMALETIKKLQHLPLIGLKHIPRVSDKYWSHFTWQYKAPGLQE